MFTVRFRTTTNRPDLLVTMRTDVDGWDTDIAGVYEHDEWRFRLPVARYQEGMRFKFLLERLYWMEGTDLTLAPVEGGNYLFDESRVRFPHPSELVVENSTVQQRFFRPNLQEDRHFDVIVIGSGIGGGILADQLSDQGADVLVLEAGSYLFPVHVANLPRQHRVGKFDKHVWGLYDEFEVHNYINSDGSQYAGGQAFNLGGRSLFWGGFIPRMSWWELDRWPTEIRWYLEDGGYQRAEDLMNRLPVTPSPYHRRIKTLMRSEFPDYNHFDAPMAVQHTDLDVRTIPNGMFSTADLLMESVLTDDQAGSRHLSLNLNHAVEHLETQDRSVIGVTAYDLISRRHRTFRSSAIVLAAGTIESAKIALMSGLSDSTGRIGIGLTDHPIYFTHFAIPAGSPHFDATSSCKILSQHKDARSDAHAFNVLLELGADFNEARYVDTDILERHLAERGNQMLCEIVFLFDAHLEEENQVRQDGPAYTRPRVSMMPSTSAAPFLGEVTTLKDSLLGLLNGIALPSDNLDLKLAQLGGVAHEVGTLRLGEDGSGVVDTNLKFRDYDNLYACDLSVFCSSPAANPTLTLAALAIRLADHLTNEVVRR